MLGNDKDLTDEGIVLVVEDASRIEGLTLDARLEMQMYACRSACLPFQSYWIACLQPLPYLDKIAGMVAVERLQTVRMTQDDAVSIGKIRPREDNFARKSGPRGIASKACSASGASRFSKLSKPVVP